MAKKKGTDKARCLHCDREPVVRGVCNRCHHRIRYAFKNDMDAAEAKGLVLPAYNGNRNDELGRKLREATAK